jgi:hypothetical protein
MQEGAGPCRPWQGHAFFASGVAASPRRPRAGVTVMLSDRIVLLFYFFRVTLLPARKQVDSEPTDT